jgi:hypothetical protein
MRVLSTNSLENPGGAALSFSVRKAKPSWFCQTAFSTLSAVKPTKQCIREYPKGGIFPDSRACERRVYVRAQQACEEFPPEFLSSSEPVLPEMGGHQGSEGSPIGYR